MLPGVENLSGIRTFRVLRALRTISAVKGRETFAICVYLKSKLCTEELLRENSQVVLHY